MMKKIKFRHVECLGCGSKLVISADDKEEYCCVNCGTANKSQIESLKAAIEDVLSDYMNEDDPRRKTVLPKFTDEETEVIGKLQAEAFLTKWRNSQKPRALLELFFPLPLNNREMSKKEKRRWNLGRGFVIFIIVYFVILFVIGFLKK